jgi:nickel-type superoxide dismutase maturation protease
MAPPSNDRVEGRTYHRLRRWAPPIVASAAAAVVAARRWRPVAVEVRGGSMAPTLVAGDWALVVEPRRIRVGDVVVMRSPDRPELELVKRVTAAPGDAVAGVGMLAPDQWWVEGDDPPASTDSRRFGPVGRSDLRGRVVAIYWPPARRRLLRRRRRR